MKSFALGIPHIIRYLQGDHLLETDRLATLSLTPGWITAGYWNSATRKEDELQVFKQSAVRLSSMWRCKFAW